MLIGIMTVFSLTILSVDERDDCRLRSDLSCVRGGGMGSVNVHGGNSFSGAKEMLSTVSVPASSACVPYSVEPDASSGFAGSDDVVVERTTAFELIT